MSADVSPGLNALSNSSSGCGNLPVPAHVGCILRLALANPTGTACYMNATLLSLLWSISYSHRPGVPTHYGGLAGVYQLAQVSLLLRSS